MLKHCLNCRAEFNTNKKDQKFCSTKCRIAHWMKMHPRVDMTKEKK